MFPAPHGMVCAALLPHVLRVNLRALHVREPANSYLTRFTALGQLFTGNASATAVHAVRSALLTP